MVTFLNILMLADIIAIIYVVYLLRTLDSET